MSLSKQLYVVGKECVHRAVSMITHIVDSVGTDGVRRSKQLCYTSLSDHIDTASQLLTVYMHHQHPGEITNISIIIIVIIRYAPGARSRSNVP